MRLFIAFEVAEEIKQNILKIYPALEEFTELKLVKAENIHITLKFLGEVSEDKKNVLVDYLGELCNQFYAFNVTYVGLGAFPNTRHPRVIWVGVECEPTINKLVDRLNTFCHQYKIGQEESREFKPHLTVGRIKRETNNVKLAQILESHKNTNFGAQSIKEIILFKSILSPTGPNYTKLFIAQLRIQS